MYRQPLALAFLLVAKVVCQQIPLSLHHQEECVAADYPLSFADTAEVISLHKHLIETESTSGNEEQVALWLASYLEKEVGLSVEFQNVTRTGFNIFAYPKGQRGAKLLVTSHIDTVPPYIPYSLRGNEIWGRGSVDAKACVAAQVVAMARLLRSSALDHSVPVALLYVVGEETSGSGMKLFSSLNHVNFTAVLFGEPTESTLPSGHKGMLLFNLTITGKAAHSGYPWLGLSANAYMVQALAALLQMEKDLPQSERLGSSTLNIGQIQGGVAANVVSESASARLSIRIAAGTPLVVRKIVEKAIDPIAHDINQAGGSLQLAFDDRAYGPVHLHTDIPGIKSSKGVNYGTDVPNLEGQHKKYLYGPGSIFVAHGPHEHLTVDQLTGAVSAYQHMITQLLHRHS